MKLLGMQVIIKGLQGFFLFKRSLEFPKLNISDKHSVGRCNGNDESS